jgi:hypothetical protein
MPHKIDRRQKPVWQQVRRPLPPPSKPHSSKKGKKGYDRKDEAWKKEIAAPGQIRMPQAHGPSPPLI